MADIPKRPPFKAWPAMTDEEKIATIRWNNACGSPGAQREVKFLLERLDALTSPPTHDERQEGLSDSHSESYRLGWRTGRLQANAEATRRARDAEAEVDRLRAENARAMECFDRDQGVISDLHVENARLRAQVAALTSALERTQSNFQSAVRGLPVRDMAENLAENRAALNLTRWSRD